MESLEAEIEEKSLAGQNYENDNQDDDDDAFNGDSDSDLDFLMVQTPDFS